MADDLLFVRTNRAAYLVMPVRDALRERMNMLFGYCYRLFAVKYWQFDKKYDKWRKVIAYNQYVTEQPVPVCVRDQIVEMRNATDIERSLYDVCYRKEKAWPKVKWTKYKDGLHRYLALNFMTDNTVKAHP